jgi:DNA-binding MarR family transcriptional regulator
VRAGDDRREKRLTITPSGLAKLDQARPAWERAQGKIRSLLPDRIWKGLIEALPEVARVMADE